MNQKIFFILLGLIFSINIYSQKETVFLSYTSDIPFQTSNESEYYHLEATLMIREIITDVVKVLEKNENDKRDFEFTVIIKNESGAVFPINYLVNSTPYSSEQTKQIFMERTYDWFNRSFRSNIPYSD